MNAMKMYIGYFVGVLVIALVMALIGWGAPMSGKGDKELVKAAIELRDSVEVTSDIEFGPLAEVEKDGKEINYQTATFMVGDSVKKVVFCKVNKGFLKYKFDSLIELQ